MCQRLVVICNSLKHFLNGKNGTWSLQFFARKISLRLLTGFIVIAGYYKNPTIEMLAEAEENDLRMGGAIFIQKSSCKGGKFLAPRKIKINQILTDSKKIDFSLAYFAVPVTTIHVKDFLGGVKLTVPLGVRVETHAVGLPKQ
mmetsp:Transcript_10185/g.14947  ORF Transcript_10185/g.14947 Transcript_10185/m.14947 type:complete len:143 (-) Transcript_10185:14-442(-)